MHNSQYVVSLVESNLLNTDSNSNRWRKKVKIAEEEEKEQQEEGGTEEEEEECSPCRAVYK